MFWNLYLIKSDFLRLNGDIFTWQDISDINKQYYVLMEFIYSKAAFYQEKQ